MYLTIHSVKPDAASASITLVIVGLGKGAMCLSEGLLTYCSRHLRRMHNPQFYASGGRPVNTGYNEKPFS